MWLPGDRPTARPRASRSVVLARNGIVATSQPLASAAGLQVLMEGGNAVDAASTTYLVLCIELLDRRFSLLQYFSTRAIV